MASRRGSTNGASKQALQLKITLLGCNPPIWRRLLVLDSTSLHALHLVLQDAMGWTNSHLYEFRIDGRRYAARHPDDDIYGEPPLDARRIPLQGLRLRKGHRFTYLYDFGDHWDHDIVVEDVVAPVAGEAYPCCTAGARACPPEDCGGIPGYAELLDALEDPENPDYCERLEWVPEGFDPAAFDPAKVNGVLQRFGRRRSRRSAPRPEA